MVFDVKMNADISIGAIANNINETLKQLSCHRGKTFVFTGRGNTYKEQRFNYSPSEISTISGFELVATTRNTSTFGYHPQTKRRRQLTGLDGCNR